MLVVKIKYLMLYMYRPPIKNYTWDDTRAQVPGPPITFLLNSDYVILTLPSRFFKK